MKNNVRENPLKQSQFGIFYPVGYIVAGLRTEDDAQQVQQALKTGGYDDNDCLLFTAEEVAGMADENLERNQGFLARLGASDKAVKKHLEEANKGAAFLLIYAPNDIDVERVMNVLHRTQFVFAHRYHRLAIEELS